ncbi:MAG TPA: hypothetical protein PKY56_02220 [Candidatus Kapabacteria bacterium]|nr:hypothetical protein [Candidatus Kapabacteria bacterium]HPO61538.1 hypothetical protein [Candidatus Kapabacteria bacterium]
MKNLLLILIACFSLVIASCSEKEGPNKDEKGSGEPSKVDSTIFGDGTIYGKRYTIRIDGFISDSVAKELILKRVDVDKTVKFQTSEAQIITPMSIKYIIVCSDSSKTTYQYTWENNNLVKN